MEETDTFKVLGCPFFSPFLAKEIHTLCSDFQTEGLLRGARGEWVCQPCFSIEATVPGIVFEGVEGSEALGSQELIYCAQLVG